MSNLKSRTINSIKWTSAQTVIVAISGPLLMLFKARFLTPSEFGIIAILSIFIGLLNTFENFGISQAIIQKQNISKEEISSLFFLNIIIVFIVGGTLYSLSGIFANLFSMSQLSILLKVASIMVIINGPSLLFRALLEKSLLFKEISLINIIRNVSLLLITLMFLYLDYGVFGIVLAELIAILISVILVILTAAKNKMVSISIFFSFIKVKPFISFGIYVFGKQLMTYMIHRIDELIIGLFLSNEILGIYHFAKNLLEKLRELITSSFSKVLFPVLSKIQNDISRLSNVYLQISKYLGIFSFPIFVGIALTGEYFVPLIFGEQWKESIPFFQAFSLILIPLILTANLSSSLLYSLAKPNIVFNIELLTNSIYIILLLIFSKYGIHYVLLTYAIYVISKTIALQFITSKHLKFTFLDYILVFKNIVLSTLIMSAVVICFQVLFHNQLIILIFIISMLLGATVYILCIYILEKEIIKQFLKDIKYF